MRVTLQQAILLLHEIIRKSFAPAAKKCCSKRDVLPIDFLFLNPVHRLEDISRGLAFDVDWLASTRQRWSFNQTMLSKRSTGFEKHYLQ